LSRSLQHTTMASTVLMSEPSSLYGADSDGKMTRAEWTRKFTDISSQQHVSRKEWHNNGGDMELFDRVGKRACAVMTRAEWEAAFPWDENVDQLLVKLEKVYQSFEANLSSRVGKEVFEKQILELAGSSRDLFQKAVSGDKAKLEGVFGGDCIRFHRFKHVFTGVKLNSSDTRIAEAVELIDIIEQVLRERGALKDFQVASSPGSLEFPTIGSEDFEFAPVEGTSDVVKASTSQPKIVVIEEAGTGAVKKDAGPWADLESEAPFLAQAFKLLSDCENNIYVEMNAAQGDWEKSMQIDLEVEDRFEACEATCQELFGKSFDHHDTNGDGLFDKDEAAVFFNHYVDADQLRMDRKMEEGGAMQNMMMEWGMEDESEAAVRAELAAERKQVATMYEEYKAHKMERDAAAFAVMGRTRSEELEDYFGMNNRSRDKSGDIMEESGDRTLKKETFLAFLTENSSENGSLRSALGIPVHNC